MRNRTIKKDFGHRSLALFVYGTLKRGCENHKAFCQGVVAVEPARVRGRLYQHPAGFPMMHLPAADILARGTADALEDVAAQASHQMELSGSNSKLRLEIPEEYWRLIRGELMIFDDPQPRLAAIDELEDFCPGRPSLYHRVLVPVLTGNNLVVSAWVYVSAIGTEDLKPIEADYWECP